MLQRAASNAYSWWWASHIRTSQSKWLDNNLQDMEERIRSMLKIIEEDADSFAKRAEMYYKRRPELISFVEETYRAYRALAERYDRISGELHKVNHTLATVFPDVEFPMQDEDDDGFSRALPSTDSLGKLPPDFPGISLHKPPPEVPKISLISRKSENKTPPQKPQREAPRKPRPESITSQLTEDEAKEAIDKLQKGILVLQTEKEFVKSSYESGIAKSWEIDRKITEMQEEVCYLEDEFSASSVIEDDEARALMAVTALKSCKDALVNLQEQQNRSTEVTRFESGRIKDAKEQLKALKSDCGQAEEEMEDIPDTNTETGPTPTMTPENESCDLEQESLDIHSICEKVKDHFMNNTSVEDLAERIDELVNKVINLELTVTSQSAQIDHLRSEIDELQKYLQSLEEEKVGLIDNTDSLNDRLKHAEGELRKVQNLEERLKSEKNMLRQVFSEACQSLSDISEKLHSPRHADQHKTAEEFQSAYADQVKSAEMQLTEHIDQVEVIDSITSQEEDSSLLKLETEKVNDVKDIPKMQDRKTEKQEDQENGSRKPDPEKDEDELTVKTSTRQNDTTHLTTAPGNQIDVPQIEIGLPVPERKKDELTVKTSTRENDTTHVATAPDNQTDVPRIVIGLPVPEKKKDELTVKTSTQENDTTRVTTAIDNHIDVPQIENGLPGPKKQKDELVVEVSAQENDTNHVTTAPDNQIDVSQRENGLRRADPEKQENALIVKESAQENDTNKVTTAPDKDIDDQDDAPNLQELLLNGLEGREKILLTEYTSILRTYKDTKRKLLEVEMKNQEYFSETMSEVKELKSANASKDEEIHLLRQILSSLQTGSNLMQNSGMTEGVKVKGTPTKDAHSGVRDGGIQTEEDIKLYLARVPQTVSPIEEKFRKDIDTLLDENLEFWLRFSTSFHQIQRFRTEFQNTQSDIEKKENNIQEVSSSSSELGGKPDSTPMGKQLRELKTELQVWLEQNALLRGELQSRFSSLCNIQEEISGALNTSSEAGGVQFTPYQAAKFQGEVLNMQQENNKVAFELQAGLDHVKGLQTEVEKTLSKLHEKFELSASSRSSHHSFRHFSSKSKGVPLRSFLYGVKPKKPSIFSCMSPALQKQYSDLRAGLPI